ncbi:hypothetical protein VTN00DRAFT_7982 [Thermoascus crustaceus]|uniref:uncharacterized protein n=1 Tax=Thermoascus crustaceus TaxID=5088 RepID=UPI0037448C51
MVVNARVWAWSPITASFLSLATSRQNSPPPHLASPDPHHLPECLATASPSADPPQLSLSHLFRASQRALLPFSDLPSRPQGLVNPLSTLVADWTACDKRGLGSGSLCHVKPCHLDGSRPIIAHFLGLPWIVVAQTGPHPY